MNSTKHLKRWIQASIVKEIRKHVEQGFPIFVEGDDRTSREIGERIEVRIDGPYITPCGTRGEMKAFIEVNLLGNSFRNEANAYRRQNLQGLIAHILNRDFCIYRIGNVGKEEADDESLVDVMRLLPMDMIKTSDFGTVDTNTEVYQCVAEAHYEMYYRE